MSGFRCIERLGLTLHRMRFILAVINEEMEIRRVKKAVLVQNLVAEGYRAFPPVAAKKDDFGECKNCCSLRLT